MIVVTDDSIKLAEGLRSNKGARSRSDVSTSKENVSRRVEKYFCEYTICGI